MRAFFFLLIALCFSWNAAKAQEADGLPQKIQGTWALPDCGRYEEALVVSRYFYLRSLPGSITLLPATLEKKGKDYWIMSLAGDNRPVRLENDGILKVGSYASGSPRKPENWDDLRLGQITEYMGCGEAPSLVPQTMLRLMSHIDKLKEQCAKEAGGACAKTLFKLADADEDKKLSLSEIKRMTATALLFATLAERRTLSEKESGEITVQAQVEGLKIADDLLSRYDADKSKDLSRKELKDDFAFPGTAAAENAVKKAAALLPGLKSLSSDLKTTAR